MYRIIKRDGKIVDFNIDKISVAIKKAFEAVGKPYHDSVIDMMSLKVTSGFEEYIVDDLIQVEKIQDLVEITLISSGYADVAKAYILYRKQRENTRNLQNTMLGYKEMVSSFLDINDERIKEASTSPTSIGGIILSNSGEINANYWLSEIYDEEISLAHKNGDMYISGLSSLTGSSASWSLKSLMAKGLNGMSGMVKSGPANHLSTILMHVARFLSISQNEWAGPQSFTNFDTYLAPYIKKDNLSYVDVKQLVQTFIYEINTPSYIGAHAPYTYIGLDINVPEKLKDEYALIKGNKQEFKYAECLKEMEMLDKAIFEVMLEGDFEGDPFNFPVLTIKIDDDFKYEDNELNKLLFKTVLKYPNCYINNQTGKLTRSGSGLIEDRGSIGIVTLNLVRCAYLSKNEEEFYERVDRVLELAIRSLHIKKEIATRLFDNGLYPLSKYYQADIKKIAGNIGLLGFKEIGLNASWIKADLSDKNCLDFIIRMLSHIKSSVSKLSRQYHEIILLNEIESVNASRTLAKLDKKNYENVITSYNADNKPIYSDCSYSDGDLFTKLDYENRVQKYFTGNTVVKINESYDLDYKQLMLLINKIIDNYNISFIGV